MIDNEVIEKLEVAEAFIKNAREYVNSFLVDGKTLREWRRELHIKIPTDHKDLSLATIAMLSSELAKNYQTAAYYRDKDSVALAVMEQIKADKYYDEYYKAKTTHDKTHSKQLAAASCDALAKRATKNITDAANIQAMIKDFWTKTCQMLQETRKLLEIIGYAVGAEAKITKENNLLFGNENDN